MDWASGCTSFKTSLASSRPSAPMDDCLTSDRLNMNIWTLEADRNPQIKMHFQNLVLHNLIEKSEILKCMTEDKDFTQCYITEGNYSFSYKKYDDLDFQDVVDGFGVAAGELIYIAFGIFHKDAMVAADKLDCKEYMFMLIDKWIREEAPWEACPSMQSEILFNSELMHRWTRVMEKCFKYDQDEALNRLWIPGVKGTQHFWKHVRSYNTAAVLLDKAVPVPPKHVYTFIRNDMLDMFEMLLERKLIDVNGSYNGKTFLMMAVLSHKYKFVNALLRNGANPQLGMNGLTPLSCAETEIHSYKIYNLLLRAIDQEQHN